MKLAITLAACVFAICAAGCDDETNVRPDASVADAGATDAAANDAPLGQTRFGLITSAPWKRTAYTSDPAYDWYGNGTADTDVLAIMKPCELDNVFTFRTDGVFQTDESLTKCKPADPQTVLTYWTFDNDATELVFDTVDRYAVLELTATTLKVESTFEEQGVTYTHVETYGH